MAKSWARALVNRTMLMSRGHLTGVLGIVVSTDQMVFVAKHRHRKVPWGLPGGIIERREAPKMALVREMQEEFGWQTSAEDWFLLDVVHSQIFPLIEICYVFKQKIDRSSSGADLGESMRPVGLELLQEHQNSEIIEASFFDLKRSDVLPEMLERHRKLGFQALQL